MAPVPIRPISSAPPRGKRSDAAASMVGHMKHTPAPQMVAANSPVAAECAWLSSQSPPDARRQENHKRPTGDRRCASVPAKWRITNMRPLT